MSPPCPPAPKCGFIKGNEKIMMLLERVKPEIVAFRETIITVSESPSLRRWMLSHFSKTPNNVDMNTSEMFTCLSKTHLCSVAAGLLLDSAPHPKNRRWKWLWGRHPGTSCASGHISVKFSEVFNELLAIVCHHRRKSWRESLQWRPKLTVFRPTSTSRSGRNVACGWLRLV